MSKRKSISKTMRFEIFKRDSFTCQYCGRMAPDVVLEVDHIHPVSKGGDNDILNLVTSCMDCNRGKGARKLTQNGEIKKQQEQLKELNEKRQQLEMMVEWKNELLKFEQQQVEKIKELIEEIIDKNIRLSVRGYDTINKLIKKYDFALVYDATKVAFTEYYGVEEMSISDTFGYVSRIAYNMDKDKNEPMTYRRNYVKKTVKNRFEKYNERLLNYVVFNYITDEDSFNEMYAIACDSDDWEIFLDTVIDVFRTED